MKRTTLWFTGSISKADPYFVAQAFPDGYGSWDNGGNDTRVGNLTWNHTFSPSVLNEARLGYTYHGPVRQGMNATSIRARFFPISTARCLSAVCPKSMSAGLYRSAITAAANAASSSRGNSSTTSHSSGTATR